MVSSEASKGSVRSRSEPRSPPLHPPLPVVFPRLPMGDGRFNGSGTNFQKVDAVAEEGMQVKQVEEKEESEDRKRAREEGIGEVESVKASGVQRIEIEAYYQLHSDGDLRDMLKQEMAAGRDRGKD